MISVGSEELAAELAAQLQPAHRVEAFAHGRAIAGDTRHLRARAAGRVPCSAARKAGYRAREYAYL